MALRLWTTLSIKQAGANVQTANSLIFAHMPAIARAESRPRSAIADRGVLADAPGVGTGLYESLAQYDAYHGKSAETRHLKPGELSTGTTIMAVAFEGGVVLCAGAEL
ncbi:hypothetical protein THAOC_07389, partial [Thalassiosira oceanica]